MSDPSLEQAVRNLYAADPGREVQRLERHRTEGAVTLRALREYLVPAPACILDCGGGPGRYAIELARLGYDVTLFDLSPELLSVAQARSTEAGVALSGYEQGTATDLSRFPFESFDAVLLMGPLYHLLDEADRQRALAEAYRVLKPGGVLFAAHIVRYAAHRDAISRYPEVVLQQPDELRQIAETGLLPPRADGRVAFTAYFAHPNEIEPACRACGFDVLTVIGVEGLAAGCEEKLNALHGPAWDYWVDANYTIGRDPSTHGAAEHLLAVCSKPRWRRVLLQIATRLAQEGISYRLVGGTSLALRGIPVPVSDLDLELSVVDIYRFQHVFAHQVVLPVAFRETEAVRSHFGRFMMDGIPVETMASLEWNHDGVWKPSFLTTLEHVELDGTPVPLLAVEEEALAYIRRGHLDRAALALRLCDPGKLLALLRAACVVGSF